jgi:hypothetical protein
VGLNIKTSSQIDIGSLKKTHTLPICRKLLLPPRGGEKKNLFPTIVSGLSSNYLHWAGMDVFWNDPFFMATCGWVQL